MIRFYLSLVRSVAYGKSEVKLFACKEIINAKLEDNGTYICRATSLTDEPMITRMNVNVLSGQTFFIIHNMFWNVVNHTIIVGFILCGHTCQMCIPDDVFYIHNVALCVAKLECMYQFIIEL
jgi:hypothetical protein